MRSENSVFQSNHLDSRLFWLANVYFAACALTALLAPSAVYVHFHLGLNVCFVFLMGAVAFRRHTTPKAQSVSALSAGGLFLLAIRYGHEQGYYALPFMVGAIS